MYLFSKKNLLKPSISIPKPVKYFVKTIQFFSDKLVVLVAVKLFRTPISYPTPEREKGMEESAQKKKLYVTSIQKEISVLSYGFSTKKIILAHGWSGRSTQLFLIANKLLEKGFMVISFDGPSHGKSTGKTTNMMEYIATIKAINEEFGPFVGAIGHSFGGMALLNAESKNKLFTSLVVIGSGDKVETILDNFSKNLGLREKIAKKMKYFLEENWNLKLINFAGSEAAKEINIPTLIVHDALDGDVAVSCALNIRRNLQNGTLYITSGLGHTKILRDIQVANKIVNFTLKNS